MAYLEDLDKQLIFISITGQKTKGTKAPSKPGSSRESATITTSSQISTAELKGIIDRLRYQQYRDSTRKNYYSIWKIFCKFFIKLDQKPDNWEDRLVLFVGHLVNSKKQSSTVKSYISAIKAILKEDKNIKFDESQYLIQALTRACKLQNDQIRTRLPIKKSLLAIIVNKVKEVYTTQLYLSLLYQMIFGTMYFGLLRISEVTGTQHSVKAADIQVGTNKRKFRLILRTSKTHWKNMKPQLIVISATHNDHMDGNQPTATSLPCPYKLLDEYSTCRRDYIDENEPFFINRDGSPVSPEQLVRCLKLMIKKAGFDQTLYGSHSIRIGRTCDLFKLGLSIDLIKKLGRWKSNAVYRYLRE